MGETDLVVVAISLFTAALMLFLFRRLRAGRSVTLRPLTAYRALREQAGLAVESGRRPVLTLGRGPLHRQSGPASVAALHTLNHVAATGGQSKIAPKVSVGTPTLFPLAQDSLRRAVGRSGRRDDVLFLADDAFPYAYAAGAGEVAAGEDAGSNIAVGRFGPEIAIVAEAGRRHEHVQILGSDDPVAAAIATAYTDNALWGEEIFAAGAYLQPTALQMAGIQVQDVLRWLLAAAILIGAVARLVAAA